MSGAPKWQAGKLYVPGDIVQPVSQPPVVATAIPNAGFEDGDTGWSKAGGFTILNDPAGAYSGSGFARFVYNGGSGGGVATTARFPVTAGQSITASCMMIAFGAADQTGGDCNIVWLDSSGGVISTSQGNEVNVKQGVAWRKSQVTGTAPSGAVECYLQADAFALQPGGVVGVDAFTWNYTAPPSTAGLVYKAVQPEAGTSAASEPDWPTTLGVQVTDNEVIWEAIQTSRVVWEADHILRSGDAEPTWPTEVGGFVSDGTINWEAISRRVEDEKCPNSKVVAIIASKVFAADRDIVRFSATLNPLDWSSEQDAGFLGTGLQQANSNNMAVLNQYRSNLVAFNASCFQNWQADPDPAAMALLDQMDGIGSTWQQAATSVGNELFYLSQLGVRTIGIANAAENLAAGDVGSPIDPLVREAIGVATASGGKIHSTYYPGAGQYWLAFPDYPATGQSTVFVYTMTRAGSRGAWSRYLFPFAVEAFAQLGNDLFIRHGDTISRVDQYAVSDEVDGVQVPFTGTVWWPWLDFGKAGATKMLEGFDYVGTGQGPSISIGYDQRSADVFTDAYQIDPDTLTGGIVPFPVSAPTLSVKLEFAGGAEWNVQSVLLSVRDLKGGP